MGWPPPTLPFRLSAELRCRRWPGEGRAGQLTTKWSRRADRPIPFSRRGARLILNVWQAEASPPKIRTMNKPELSEVPGVVMDMEAAEVITDE